MRRPPAIGSFVVTFERPGELAGTLEALLGQSMPPQTVLVVDNGSSPEAAAVVEALSDPRVEYEATGDNLGAAGGLAHGFRRLHDLGFEWIHAVDDDDPPRTADTLERLGGLIGRHAGAGLGAVAATGSRWDWRRGEHVRVTDGELAAAGDVDVDVVAGGQHLVLSREVVDAVGTPDPEHFFGFDDALYCLRMRRAGFRVMLDGPLTLEYRRLTGRLGYVRDRPWRPRDAYRDVWRRYYVTRNYIDGMLRTFDRPDLARREARKALLRSAAAWARGPRYGARFTRLQMRGVADGFRGRLGRRLEPVPKAGKR